MSKVVLEAHDAVAVLRLNNGVTNAISSELVDDLLESVKQVKNEFNGMVLAGGEKFFCIGLDLPALLQLDQSDMVEFYGRFERAFFDLYTLPVPTACAINGHATAGGAIFALSCDFRFVSSGRRLIGLNEVKIGVPVPYLADLMLRQIVGDRCATDMMFSGKFVEPEEAKRIGLVDDVFGPDELEKKAVAKIAELAALPPSAIRVVKQNRIKAAKSRYEEVGGKDADRFLDCWFDPAVQELLGEAAKNF